MDANALKKAAAEAALQYVRDDTVVGVGTGSTVNFFIDALASRKARIEATVASSDASAQRLRALHIPVKELNDTGGCDIYVDGADEVTEHLAMIKGGGAALTREKIVAAASKTFVCICDASKLTAASATCGPRLLEPRALTFDLAPRARVRGGCADDDLAAGGTLGARLRRRSPDRGVPLCRPAACARG